KAVYMSTTVPQNMKGMKIAGRHTPTRNSLRHSRMIVVNHKNHDSLQATYIRNLNISRQLLIMQLAVGLLIVGLAAWILILAPSASILINPYLSGLSLLLASVAGLILLRRATIQEPPQSAGCGQIRAEWKYLLAFSMALNTLGIVATFLYITLFICCHRNREHFYTSV
uniref:Uncharacterized protein LOC108037383 n=1 Tax=Drosophila rhopaloa TaxID=1041015 RepID=A0A6P4DZA2_DRORH